MPRYEYKVVPAPTKGLKGKGVKGPEARFSNALETMMNGLSAEGWEFQRAETLPSIERSGLTGSTTEWRNVLVFRRQREADAEAFAPELLPPPVVPVAAKPAGEAKETSSEKEVPAKPTEPIAREADGNQAQIETDQELEDATSVTSEAAKSDVKSDA